MESFKKIHINSSPMRSIFRVTFIATRIGAGHPQFVGLVVSPEASTDPPFFQKGCQEKFKSMVGTVYKFFMST